MKIGLIGYDCAKIMRYYEGINKQVDEMTAGFSSADLFIRSFDVGFINELMLFGDWGIIAKYIIEEAVNLVVRLKCDYVAIVSNELHKVAMQVIGPHELHYGDQPCALSFEFVNLIHIDDCIIEKCIENGYKSVELVGAGEEEAAIREVLEGNSIKVSSENPQAIVVFDETLKPDTSLPIIDVEQVHIDKIAQLCLTD